VSFKLCAFLSCPTEPGFLEFGHAAAARETAKPSNRMTRLRVSRHGPILLIAVQFAASRDGRDAAFCGALP